jgi:hypothetical protein
MRSLLDLDKTQFTRIEQAILALANLPRLERQRKIHLLLALENEKEELIRSNPAIRQAFRRQAA